MKPRVILVRHGATSFNSGNGNEPERVRGHLDPPLTEDGRAEGQRLAKKFSGERIQKIYSSDLSRALDTAKTIQAEHPTRPPLAPRFALRPWNAGPTIEGKEVDKVLPKMLEYQLDTPDKAPPSGKPFNDYLRTFLGQLGNILRQARHNPELGAILIATHTRGMRATDGWMKAGQQGIRVDPEVMKAKEHLKTGEWLEYEYDAMKGKWIETKRGEEGTKEPGN